MSRFSFSIASQPHVGEVFVDRGTKRYYFKVDFQSKPVKLYAKTYFTGVVSGVCYRLLSEERALVVYEATQKLVSRGYEVALVE